MRISDWSSDVCSSDLNILLGDQLRRVEHVIGLLGRPTLIEDLNPQIPLRIIARGNRLEQVASVEIGVGPRDLHRLVPRRGLDAQHRLPVELDEAALALRIDEAEAVDAEDRKSTRLNSSH